MMRPVKLITFIGYSRVGKSSAILALASDLQQDGRRVRILHNGPGRLNADGLGLDVVEIHGGCVCCDLAMGLFSLLKKWSQEQPPLDMVLLEGSPVASPDVLEITLAQSYGWVDMAHMVTMTDAERMARVGRPLDYLTERQVASADTWFVVNADRADPARLDEVIAALEARAAPQKIGRSVEAVPLIRAAIQG
jgi:G3E family GTPase